MARSSLGKSFLQSSVLALLSYIKFEYLAKSTLIFCAITFINNPFPPASRIVSILGVGVVLILGKIERTWREGQQENQPLEGPSQEAGQQTNNNHTAAKDKQEKQLKKKD